MVKQYQYELKPSEADWLIGDQLVSNFLPQVLALRSMKEPGTAYNFGYNKDPQISHVCQMSQIPPGDHQAVHYLSGIPNKAFYLFANEFTNYSWECAGAVWYKALQACKPQSNFSDFVGQTFKAVDNLYEGTCQHGHAQKMLANAWNSVGFSPQSFIQNKNADKINRRLSDQP